MNLPTCGHPSKTRTFGGGFLNCAKCALIYMPAPHFCFECGLRKSDIAETPALKTRFRSRNGRWICGHCAKKADA